MKGSHVSIGLLVLGLLSGPALAVDPIPGVTKDEIRIGQTMPYSGPLSAVSTIGKAHSAYFAMVNERGGINGRKVNLISLDDAYSPPKTVEQTRKLVEQDEVLLIFGSVGTPTNQATRKYLNGKRVPQLFITTGANSFNDPKAAPFTMPWLPSYGAEAAIYARFILKHKPNARIAIFSQNDDYGRDYVTNFKATLGDRATEMIVSQATYETTEPTVDSQIVKLKSSNADILMNFSIGKFTAQSIRKVRELGWDVLHFVPYTSASSQAVLKGAGFENAKGIISSAFYKSSADPKWTNDAEYLAWQTWMKKYYPSGDISDDYNVGAYVSAQLLEQVLLKAGDDLSRENIMRVATGLQHMRVPMLLPGIEVNSSPSDYALVRGLSLVRFEGERWTTLEPLAAE